jgi:carbon-monoxide dehydrogenase large subunit
MTKSNSVRGTASVYVRQAGLQVSGDLTRMSLPNKKVSDHVASAQEEISYPALSPEMKLVQEAFFQHVGKPIPRKEDRRLITGKGRFSDDFNMPGQVYAAMVRSPYPHARILGIDISQAMASSGVLAVLTGQDVLDDGLQPIPHNPVPSTKFDVKLTAPGGGEPFIGPHYLLPTDKARHVGEAVAMVVAESPAQAADAAEKVIVDYEELAHVTGTAAATEEGAPAVWDEVPGNVFIESKIGDWEATDAAFAAADHVVRGDFHIDRVTAVTIEPRASLGHFDAETGKFTLYAGSGGAVRQKGELSKVLGVEPKDMRVLSFDVGGNFGARNRVYVEFGLVLWASRRVGRPVKFTATRSEAFLTDYQGRDLVTKVELALNKEGKFLAMRADNLSNVGMRCVSLSPLSKGSGLITGSYDIPVAALRARAVFTNTMCTQAYRSSGRPEVTYAIERLVEIAARELGFDPLELRRKNLIQPEAMPYTNAVGSIYDSGEYEKNMDRALEISGWNSFEARKKEAASRGKLLGRGFANYVESSIGSPKERAEIEVKEDGTIEVVIGTQPSGQGHETSFAQVVADMLQVPVEKVWIVLGDTDIVSVGGGSHSGRSMRHAGTVMAMASVDMLVEGKRRAAEYFETDTDSIDFEGGYFKVRGTNLSIDIFTLGNETRAASGPLRVARNNEMHTPVFPNGAAVCEVEVDPETGHVQITAYSTIDDVGRCINPLIVHGQTHGGIAQGVGQAMWELCAIDPTSGQPLAGSFMDYGMPRFDNLPSFNCEIAEVISPTNPLGIKAGGEGGTTPALVTVTNAVIDALKDYGVTNIAMPLTPFAVWKSINERAQAAQ